MKKVFYIFCSLWIALAFFILIGSKINSIGRRFIERNGIGNHHFGDLYDFAQVALFKGNIAVHTASENNTIENAKIITMGDSFFQTQYDSDFFGNELKKAVHLPVFSVPETVENPLDYLESIHYKKSTRKTLIVESIERYFLGRAVNYPLPREQKSVDSTSPAPYWFVNTDMEYFFDNNIFIKPLRRLVRNFKFDTFRTIDERTPVYSETPPMLFFNEEVVFAHRKKDEAEIMRMADNIRDLGSILREKYNLDLIYVIIPNKYSIYHDLAKKDSAYDNFIPRVQAELQKNNVCFIDLYGAYMNYRKNGGSEPLYYGSDTHFTALGKRILVEGVRNMLK